MALTIFIALLGMFAIGFVSGWCWHSMEAHFKRLDAEWAEFDRRMAEEDS